MKVLGITGGSGAGKSTVVEKWKKMGATILNADEVYHNLLLTNKQMIWEIEDYFPESIVDGAIKRKKLGEIVFQNQEKLAKLNEISHPHVIQEIRNLLNIAREKQLKIVVIEALYLLETDLNNVCDTVIAVIAPTELRMQRIIARDHIDESYAWTRISSQQSDDYYLQNSDMLIENDGYLEKLNLKAEKILNSLLEKN